VRVLVFETHGCQALEVALSERERAILDFERSWWMREGSKESAIREELGMSAARYYQVLGRLLDTHDALAYDPLLIRRLRRLRDRRRRARFEGSSARPGH
jgi:hypothetical protein